MVAIVNDLLLLLLTPPNTILNGAAAITDIDSKKKEKFSTIMKEFYMILLPFNFEP